mmetsp:Transcript_162562/g.521143  ORF Transcript_162562/g.521143 Transcript_162562/m.521143 type:complete len:200 (+) Transcript_162562:2417-3016(+)
MRAGPSTACWAKEACLFGRSASCMRIVGETTSSAFWMSSACTAQLGCRTWARCGSTRFRRRWPATMHSRPPLPRRRCSATPPRGFAMAASSWAPCRMPRASSRLSRRRSRKATAWDWVRSSSEWSSSPRSGRKWRATRRPGGPSTLRPQARTCSESCTSSHCATPSRGATSHWSTLKLSGAWHSGMAWFCIGARHLWRT